MKKLSMLLALVMLFSAFSLSAFAADTPTASISSATASAGETVTLSISMKNSPGIVGAQFFVGYDANVMSFVSGKAASNGFYTQFSSKQGANPVKVVLANLSFKEVTGDIAIAEISFMINDNAASGEYTVSLSSAEAYDADIATVVVAAENGTVTVKGSNSSSPTIGGATHKHSYKETSVAASGAEPGYTLYACSCGHSYKGNFVYGDAVKFAKQREYTGAFTDVPEANWYYDYVKLAYEYGLANGTSDTKFSPDNNFTVAQALTAAVNIHKAYYGTAVRAAAADEKWYDPYVEYCVESKIITEGQFTNMDANITRGEMAMVFANILPDAEYTATKTGSNPDVTDDMACATAVQKLFHAGIVGGDAGTGNYRPNDEILRSEACVIFTRIAVAEKRAQ